MAVVLVAGFLASGGCHRPQAERIRKDDIRVTVVLTRGFIRGNSAPEGEESSSCPLADKTGGELARHEDGAKVFLALTLVGILFMDCTDVRVYPDGYPEYCQPLYWGKNSIYLPGGCRGKKVVMFMEWEGAHAGQCHFLVDLAKKRSRVEL